MVQAISLYSISFSHLIKENYMSWAPYMPYDRLMEPHKCTVWTSNKLTTKLKLILVYFPFHAYVIIFLSYKQRKGKHADWLSSLPSSCKRLHAIQSKAILVRKKNAEWCNEIEAFDGNTHAFGSCSVCLWALQFKCLLINSISSWFFISSWN